jgi:hypothetical protein
VHRQVHWTWIVDDNGRDRRVSDQRAAVAVGGLGELRVEVSGERMRPLPASPMVRSVAVMLELPETIMSLGKKLLFGTPPTTNVPTTSKEPGPRTDARSPLFKVRLPSTVNVPLLISRELSFPEITALLQISVAVGGQVRVR